MHILHCPSDVGGNPWGLSRAERALGLQSDMVVFNQQWFGYNNDINLNLNASPVLIKDFKRFRFYKSALDKYDVFHFNFGRSILDYPFSGIFNYIDLPALKRKGKKVMMTFQGCDARIKQYCCKNFEISACAECKVWYCNRVTDAMKERRLAKISKFADNIFVLNPDLKHFLPDAEFLPYASVDPRQWRPAENHSSGETDTHINLLHAPSNRSIKGTEHIIQACKALEKEGYPVNLVLAENIPHAKMKAVYESADIFVDQLLVGWYGAAAVEAMSLGKPSVCYLRESDVSWLPFKDSIPVISATCDTIYDVLLDLIENRRHLKDIGMRSRAYVEGVHDPVKIALQLKHIYEL